MQYEFPNIRKYHDKTVELPVDDVSFDELINALPGASAEITVEEAFHGGNRDNAAVHILFRVC